MYFISIEITHTFNVFSLNSSKATCRNLGRAVEWFQLQSSCKSISNTYLSSFRSQFRRLRGFMAKQRSFREEISTV